MSNLEYDGTDYPPAYTLGFPIKIKGNNTDLGFSILNFNYNTKDFIKDLIKEAEPPRIIRFLNVFLYGAMIIVDWLEKKLKRS